MTVLTCCPCHHQGQASRQQRWNVHIISWMFPRDCHLNRTRGKLSGPPWNVSPFAFRKPFYEWLQDAVLCPRQQPSHHLRFPPLLYHPRRQHASEPGYLLTISGTCPVFSITTAPTAVQAPIDYRTTLLTSLALCRPSGPCPASCHRALPQARSFPSIKSDCVLLRTVLYHKAGAQGSSFSSLCLPFSLASGHFLCLLQLSVTRNSLWLLGGPCFPWAQWPLKNLLSG